MEMRVVSAAQRRQEIQARAAKMGIDDAYIATLVETFYQRIRAHPLIGPIFEQAIGDNWDPHLDRMKDFWSSVALNAGRYSGKPVPAHQKLDGVEPWHFSIWLALFRQTLEDTAPTPPPSPISWSVPNGSPKASSSPCSAAPSCRGNGNDV